MSLSASDKDLWPLHWGLTHIQGDLTWKYLSPIHRKAPPDLRSFCLGMNLGTTLFHLLHWENRVSLGIQIQEGSREVGSEAVRIVTLLWDTGCLRLIIFLALNLKAQDR